MLGRKTWDDNNIIVIYDIKIWWGSNPGEVSRYILLVAVVVVVGGMEEERRGYGQTFFGG